MQLLIKYWVYGGFLSGWLFLFLSPVICAGWSATMILVFLQLPIYMLHQFEEHNDDRFRIFFNKTIGHGKDVLSASDVFVINIFGVWGVNVISIILAYYVQVGYGLIGVYLTLINALAHIAQGIGMRRYNPGLITAVILFLPAGGIALWQMIASGEATLFQNGLGLLIAIGIHASIMIYAKKRKANLQG